MDPHQPGQQEGSGQSTRRSVSGRFGQLGRSATVWVIATLVLGMFVRSGGIDIIGRATVPDMVYGRAHRPFVQRALVPLVVRGLVAAMPTSLEQRIEAATRPGTALWGVFQRLRWDQAYPLEYLSVCVVMLPSLVAFAHVMVALAMDLYGQGPVTAWAAAVIALLFLPPFFSERYYSAIYDFTNLFLFSAGLRAMLRRTWWAYWLVFVLACVNKETAILLTLIFVLRHRVDLMVAGPLRAAILTALAAQVLVWGAIRIAIGALFAGNPGTSIEVHVVENLIAYTEGYPLSLIVSLGLVGAAVIRDWHAKPRFLRQALWVGVPLLLSLPVFGYEWELRACYEAYPVVVLLALPTVLQALGVHFETTADGALACS